MLPNRNTFLKKQQPDGKIIKTMAGEQLAPKLVGDGWEEITPIEYVHLRATCVFLTGDYEPKAIVQ